MEPVTHILTGACLGRTGLNRKAAYATLTMAVAAEFPDIDTLWSVRGPVASFTHHRGITHTFLGVPFEAAMVVGLVWVLHRWRVSRGKEATAAPVRWGLLYGFALVALLSHLFLDWTNNYGLRPFFPFDRHWFAGSFVFIFDPVLFVLLLAAIVMPFLFGLIGSEVGARRKVFRGRGWATAMLTLIALYWGVRAWEHGRAVTLAEGQSFAVAGAGIESAASTPQLEYLQPRRVLANPDPFNPLRWHAVTDFGASYVLAEVDLSAGTVVPDQTTYSRPVRTPAVLAAMASPLGRAYMDWSPMPIVTEGPRVPEEAAGAEKTVVTFRDPRFMVDLPLMRNRNAPPLTAQVDVGADGRVRRQTMDGSVQK